MLRVQSRIDLPRFQVGSYTLFWMEPRLRIGKETLDFTGKEGRILSYLLYHPGQIIPKEKFRKELGMVSGSRSLDVLISRIRKKIKALLPKVENPIRQVRGRGYYLDL
jgi:DNA-binding response OmpR family regulator